MNIETMVETEKLNIEKSMANIESQIASLPEGALQVNRNGGTYNWLQIFPKQKGKAHRKYVSKNDRQLAEALAYKGYLRARLLDDKANLKAANLYLKYHVGDKHVDKYVDESAGRRELFMPKLRRSDKAIETWMRDVYTGEVPEKQNLRYESQAGFKVRSKSEQIIVALLMKYQVPFKYEQHLYVNGNNLYPDFTIMHPKTHKLYVWEHLGMMDNYKYRSHNFDKINDYCLLGFIPGDNLILTYETGESGLDEILVEKLIQHYF